MTNDVVIKVENLSKQYRIGAKEGYKTLRETNKKRCQETQKKSLKNYKG